MQVLARWGGQVCRKTSEYMGSTSTCPERSVKLWDEVGGQPQRWSQRWSLLAGGEMFCGERQSDAGIWVCLHDSAGGEAKGWGKLVPQHIGVCAAGIDVHTGVIQVQLASPGREQVQKWQHTSVMCLHIDNDSLGHFYVGDGSICFIRQILFYWSLLLLALSLQEYPTKTGSWAWGKTTRETLCQQGTNTGKSAFNSARNHLLLWLTASAERSLCHSVFKHSIQACDLKNPNLGLNINPQVKSLQ